MSHPVIHMDKVCFSYEKGKNILEDFSLKIDPKDRVGIIGPNGSGKTTLFLLMSGVEKPKSGHVYLFGEKVRHRRFYPQLGMIFQNTEDQIFHPSVYEDIAFGPKNMGFNRKEVKERVDYAMNTLSIHHLKDKLSHELSGGEKRLVSIAGILSMGSKFVIYDEPTSNLDHFYRRKLMDFLKDSHEESMIVASHDLEFILKVCNRVILLDKGTIYADGDPKKVLRNEKLMKEHHLEVPYSLQ